MPNSPDSSLLLAVNGSVPEPSSVNEPGRSIDVQAESAETEEDALRELSRLLERAPVPARKKRADRMPPSTPQLPIECVGIACLIRTRLQQLGERCGNDRKCWEQALKQEPQTRAES